MHTGVFHDRDDNGNPIPRPEDSVPPSNCKDENELCSEWAFFGGGLALEVGGRSLSGHCSGATCGALQTCLCGWNVNPQGLLIPNAAAPLCACCHHLVASTALHTRTPAECDKNPAYMLEGCKLSCGICQPEGDDEGAEIKPPPPLEDLKKQQQAQE